jgi:molecular chaperone DnaK
MKRHKAVGIDLGTTYSGLAVINPAGKPEIVPNAEGERTTASAVFFHPDGSEYVGQDAIDSAGAYSDRVARWVKRELGTSWNFSVEEDDGQQGASRREYSAIDISAKILSKIKQDAELTLDSIEKAVVTIPAEFSDAARRATIDAAERAGLEVLKIINEPTAAALAYASSGQSAGTVLVYDFGGGTFDASVVRIKSDNDIEVLCSNGEKQLGGHDLDLALAEHLSELFESQEGVHLLRDGDANTRHNVTEEAEKTKKTLSRMEVRSGIPLTYRQGASMTCEVSRETFEDLISTHIEKTMMCVELSLAEAEIEAAAIDDVILVGGSTRIPAVEGALLELFGKKPLQSINPDEAVALGAAIQAAILLKDEADLPPVVIESMGDFTLSDVAHHSYGTACVEDIFGTGKLDVRNDIIIPKGTKIPCSVTKFYQTVSDNQTEINCRVTQGEGEIIDFVDVRKSGVLQVPPGRKAGCEIVVTYSYDANEVMSCEFKDAESGKLTDFALDLQDNQAPIALDDNDDIAGLEDLDFE